MNRQCEIVRDILPLYVDEVCSEASAEMVKEHLATCAECNEIYQQMLSHTSEDILREESKGVIERHKAKEKQKNRRNIIIAVLVAVAAMTILATFGLSFELMNWWNLLVFCFIPALSVLIMFFVKKKFLWTAPLISTAAAVVISIIVMPDILTINEYRAMFFGISIPIQLAVVIPLTLIAYGVAHVLKKKQ